MSREGSPMMSGILSFSGTTGIVLLVLSGIGMSLYWEREWLVQLGRELVAVMRGEGRERRRRRQFLVVLGACVLVAAVVVLGEARASAATTLANSCSSPLECARP